MTGQRRLGADHGAGRTDALDRLFANVGLQFLVVVSEP